MRFLLSSAIVVLILSHPTGARAQREITVIAPGGIRTALEQLLPEFERTTGHKVRATFASGVVTRQQIARGDACDAAIVQPPYPEVLASGNLVAGSATPLASIALGIAVRQGSPKPDISRPEAAMRTLLAAKSVAIPDPAAAAAGVSFEETLGKLGISGQMRSKIKLGQGAAGAMAMVARGDADLGATFLSEMNDPGIEVVGPLPVEISARVPLVGFVSAHAKDADAAKALLVYLSSPAAAAVYSKQRMQPAR